MSLRALLVLACVACGQAPVPNVVAPAASALDAGLVAAECDASTYVPHAAWSGPAATIPDPPPMPSAPERTDRGYTVAGAVHALRSVALADDVSRVPIDVVGIVVDTNVARAPKCAVHPSRKPDPPDCEADAPSFWITDDAADPSAAKIRVVGWARNFAVVYDAMRDYKRLAPGATPPIAEHDDFFDVDVPFPLPAVGMKVVVHGRYDFATWFGGQVVREPVGGVLRYASMMMLSPAPKPASFAAGGP